MLFFIHFFKLNEHETYILHFRNKTFIIEKQFFNKKKTITYTAHLWLRTEKYLKTIQQARQSGTNVKLHIIGEMYVCSDL